MNEGTSPELVVKSYTYHHGDATPITGSLSVYISHSELETHCKTPPNGKTPPNRKILYSIVTELTEALKPIQLWLTGESALGAARHGALVPWSTRDVVTMATWVNSREEVEEAEGRLRKRGVLLEWGDGGRVAIATNKRAGYNGGRVEIDFVDLAYWTVRSTRYSVWDLPYDGFYPLLPCTLGPVSGCWLPSNLRKSLERMFGKRWYYEWVLLEEREMPGPLKVYRSKDTLSELIVELADNINGWR